MSDGYDFIIVGAGTAGSVLAERLTGSGARVLLLEAGPPPDSRFVKVPAGMAKLFRTELDWALESEPMAHLGGRRLFIPRGKMLGGSANINAQIHQWGHPADYEGWVAAGAAGWGWDDVAPVLRRMEKWTGDDGGAPDRRGRSGPMIVSPLRTPSPLSLAFVAAAEAAGLTSDGDYNGGPYRGAMLSQVTQHRGRRFSVYDAYLKPALRRSNLEVRPRAHVTSIEFDGARATGITSISDGTRRRDRAERGVVLCAGAFGTPHILMLSGIGPAEHLRAHGIPLRRDAPEVGANLQDHPLLPVLHASARPITLKDAESPLNLVRWLLFGRGMLSSNVAEAMAFTSSDGAPAPDLEICFVPAEWRRQGLEPPSVHAWAAGVVLLTPRSRGSVRLSSADPTHPPAIDLALLSDADGADARRLFHGVRLVRRIARTEPLARESAGEIAPGPARESDEELLSYCSEALQTIYHPAGTCRMGSDAAAPVDPALRLRGFEGLWVADASVMPTVPRGHPNAVVAMIADRAASMITAGRAG